MRIKGRVRGRKSQVKKGKCFDFGIEG